MSYMARDLVLDAMDWRVTWPGYGLCVFIPYVSQQHCGRHVKDDPDALVSSALWLFRDGGHDYWWSFDKHGQAARDLALCFILAMVEDEE